MKTLPFTALALSSLLLFYVAPASAQVDSVPESAPDNLEGGAFPCGLGGGCEEDIISPDPTFIQISSTQQAPIRQTRLSTTSHGLVGEILIPYDGALVRANVPIFGLAYGENFKEYRVEYGEGVDPNVWTVLETSETPQRHNVIPDDLYQSADLTIEGNLGTWDTGLKNYV